MAATRRTLALLICGGLTLAGPIVWATSASGPAAVYAIVQKVVIEPNEAAPERIQVWGVFAIWDAKAGDYRAPERGYMYFSLPTPDDRQWRQGGNQPSIPIALAEWKDLRKVAGTGSAVAFGERNWTGRIRKAEEKPAAPEKYPVYNGITQLSSMDDVGPGIIARLKQAIGRE